MIEGKVGELVYVRLADGSVVVRRRPVRQAPWTVKQVGTQVRFRDAVAYAKSIADRPDLDLFYKTVAKIRRKRAWHLAVADFMKPPSLRTVEPTNKNSRKMRDLNRHLLPGIQSDHFGCGNGTWVECMR